MAVNVSRVSKPIVKTGARLTAKGAARSTAKRSALGDPAASLPEQPPVPRLPDDVSLVYADQVMDVIYGIHTSKLIFGIETGASVRPVQAVTLPTAALLFMAQTILRDLAAPGMVDETIQRLGRYVDALKSMAPPGQDATSESGKQGK